MPHPYLLNDENEITVFMITSKKYETNFKMTSEKNIYATPIFIEPWKRNLTKIYNNIQKISMPYPYLLSDENEITVFMITTQKYDIMFKRASKKIFMLHPYYILSDENKI